MRILNSIYTKTSSSTSSSLISKDDEKKLNQIFKTLSSFEVVKKFQKKDLNDEKISNSNNLWKLISKCLPKDIYPLINLIFEKCKNFNNFTPLIQYLSIYIKESIFDFESFYFLN